MDNFTRALFQTPVSFLFLGATTNWPHSSNRVIYLPTQTMSKSLSDDGIFGFFGPPPIDLAWDAISPY